MSRKRVLVMALLAAVGLAFIPELIPTGPAASLDASGLLAKGQLFIAAGVIFLGGLLTSLTPCVYPLIPITVGVFGARQADSRGRAMLLTSAYVVGMGVVFATLGVVAAFSGKAFGSALGNQWLVTALAIFLVVLASSMFGAFELALPSGLATKLNNVGGGGVIGALLMGSVAGFLAAPCTGPVLTGVLAWVSLTRDPLLGGLLLFIYALGIGVPFFLIGVFTVRLPKSGEWMEWVKSFFGVALLALAVAYLRDVFPAFREVAANLGVLVGRNVGAIAAALLAFAGVVIGAIHLSFKAKDEWLLKGVGVTTLIVAFVVRMAAIGAPSTPVETVGQPRTGAPTQLAWTLQYNPLVAGSADPFEQALARAKAECKPVMIDFSADWCAACKELDRLVYTKKDVIAESQRFVTVKVDGTTDNDILGTLYDRYGIEGLPTVTFLDPMGNISTDARVDGYIPADKFLTQMRKVAILTCSRTP